VIGSQVAIESLGSCSQVHVEQPAVMGRRFMEWSIRGLSHVSGSHCRDSAVQDSGRARVKQETRAI
jgi:hypothetical protein